MRLIRFLNHYTCETCDTEWSDNSSSTNNDGCPECGAEIEPEESEEYETDESGKADITVVLKGGLVEDVEAPKGLSILVVDHDVENEDGDELMRDPEGNEVTAHWIKEPGEANFDPVIPDLVGVIRQALSYERAAFVNDTPMDLSDLCTWFGAWRGRAQNALNSIAYIDTAKDIAEKYNVEAVAERCLLVMVGAERDTITETDIKLLRWACETSIHMLQDDHTKKQLSTWPAAWAKYDPGMMPGDEQAEGFFIACADEDADPEDAAAFMAGASPALRNLWRDARAAGFTRIELTIG